MSSSNNKISSAYRDLAIAFLIMQFIATVVRALLKEAFGPEYVKYLIGLFAPSMVIIFPLAVRVIIKVKASTAIVRLILALFVVGILSRLTAVFVLEANDGRLSLNLISSGVILVVLVLIIYHMILNLFADNHHIIEKLWASVCVYFMIGFLFGTFYSFLLLLNPDALGVTMIHPFEVYLNGVIYSINILSGHDSVFLNVTETFQMGAIMESLVSTLFLVVLLGRLLGAPN